MNHYQGRNCDQTNSLSQNNLLVRADLAEDIREYMGQSLLIVLNDDQLNILNQVFRPIFCSWQIDFSRT